MSAIIVETKDCITRIEISRPEKKYALMPEMEAAMGQALSRTCAIPICGREAGESPCRHKASTHMKREGACGVRPGRLHLA